MKERSLNPQSRDSNSKPFLQSFEMTNQKNQVAPKAQLAFIALILLALGFVVGRTQQTSEPQAKTAIPVTTKKINVLPVSTVEVTAIDSYQTTQTYTGEVTALRTSEVGFERGGKVIAINVDEGDRINTGQTIAQLDTATLQAQRKGLVAQQDQAQALLAELKNGARTEQVASAKARVQDLEKQLELAQIRTSRREYLLQEGAISQEQLDEVAFNRQVLQARLQDAQSSLAELKNGTRVERISAQEAAIKILDANIAELDLQISKSILKAPFTGIVSSRNFDEGTVVEAGSSVVRLVESDRLEVRIGVPVTTIDAVNIGSRQKISINSREYGAVVISVLPETDPNTRTRTVILALDSLQNSSLAKTKVVPGEIARLALAKTSATDGYWLPIQAVQQSDRGLWSCYSVVSDATGNSIVARQYLEVLATEANRVLVKGTIQPGDLIVSQGIHRLIPGQRVSRN